MVAKSRSKSRAFTLIEVLTVIAIIGILSSVVLVSMSGSQKKGRDGRRISDIGQIQLALSLYYDVNNSYPPNTSSLATNFISAVPQDPSGGSYYYSQGGGSYVLGASLEASNAALPGNAGTSCVSGQYAYCVRP